MTKHKPTIIDFENLEARIFTDSDDFLVSDALDIEDEDWNRDEHVGKWVLVSWPEHVINPRYNSDATYCEFDSLEDAQGYEPTASVYNA